MKTAKFRPFKTDRPTSPWRLNVPPHLSGTGKKQRLFFETQKEAFVAAEQLKARKENFGRTLSLLSPSRIGEAAECFKLLKIHFEPSNRPYSLIGIVREYIEQDKRRLASISFKELFERFIKSKKEAKRDPAYLNELRICLNRFPTLHDRIVSDLSHEDIEKVLDGLSGGAKNVQMRYLRAVFNFGIKKKLLTENPISRMEFIERKKTEVEIVPVAHVEKMLLGALQSDLELLPYLTLGFFAGIRPDGELQKLRWSDIHLEDRKIVMRPEITKKNRRRFIDIQPNALTWLQEYRNRGGAAEGPVVKLSDSELRTHRIANRKVAGITDWPNSGMSYNRKLWMTG